MTDISSLDFSKEQFTYAKIAVRIPGPNSFLTYKIPLDKNYKKGEILQIPLGKRKKEEGVLIEINSIPSNLPEGFSLDKIKVAGGPLDSVLSLSPKELELYTWMAKYYHYSLGMLVFDCLPSPLKKPRSLKIPLAENNKGEHAPNAGQAEIISSIAAKLEKGFDRFYIHGVTGSGKTIIYFELIKKILKLKKSVLFLIPEINLTPQFTDFFKRYLEEIPVFSYHSGISNSEKYQIWTYLKNNQGPVMVLGVRSSVFLPIENLGLVIVDEEHDSSFKQSDRCTYNGRDVAVKKAQLFNCPVILGSATPSLENYWTLKKNQTAHYFELPERARGNFPNVSLIDARGLDAKNENWPFALESIASIKSALDKGEQVLVFINRLGFANYIQCSHCGHKWTDPNTGVNLRYFKQKNLLSSAHSDYAIPMPDICPECSNMDLFQKGFGTEKAEEILKRIFAEHIVKRFDREEITTFNKMKERLDDFHQHKIDILVGTQMLAKGHNFEKVNNIIILGIDSQLNFPDFRAMERTYQVLCQVIGRAGRYSPESHVYIQTYGMDNPLFSHIMRHDLHSFYDEEIPVREMANLPPFCRLASLYISAKNREHLSSIAFKLKDDLETLQGLTVLGPSPVMIEKKAGMFTWEILLKSYELNILHSALGKVEHWDVPKGIQLKIDVDPYFTS